MDRFDVICRTCNTERSNLVNLTSNALASDSLILRDVLFTVCPSLPTYMAEKLPQKICYFCSKQLEIAYKFQLQCAKSHEEQWKLIESTLKKESSPMEVCVKNEDTQSIESSKSSAEEDFEDSSPVLTENLEFLDEEEIEERDDIALAVEETPERPIREPISENMEPYTESEAPIICCHCHKQFHTSKGLELHEKLAHKNLKPILLKAEILTIECKYCLQVFEKKSQLLIHCRRKHTHEFTTDLTCNFCHKTFLDKSRFKRHLLYHGKTRFLCTVKDCNRTYLIKYKLTDHLKRFHGITLSGSEIRALEPSITDES